MTGNISDHRAAPQVDIEKLTSDLEASRLSEENLKEKIARLLMHNQGDKKLLQVCVSQSLDNLSGNHKVHNLLFWV